MAITFGSASNQSTGTVVSFNAGSGTNRFLIVSCTRRGGSAISITYAGVSMTLIGSSGGHVNAGDTEFLFGLIAPASGANNVSISHNGTAVFWLAAVYNGVDQTTGYEAANTASSASGTPQVTITPTKSDWIVAGAWQAVGGNAAVADGHSILRNAGSQDNNIIVDSSSDQSSAYEVGITNTTSFDFVGCGLIDASPGVSSSKLALLGVG